MSKRRLHRLLGLMLSLYLFPAWAQTLQFDCGAGLQPVNQQVIALYVDLGVKAECVYMPPARGARMVMEGELAGSMLRVAEYGDRYRGLLRVEPAVTTMTLVIYRRKGTDVTLDNWRSKKLVSLRGAIVLDQFLAGLDVTRAASLEYAVKQLSAGRVDAMVGDLVFVPAVIEGLGVANVESLRPPVASELLYHYLHPRHAELAQRLSARLMARQGQPPP